MTSSPPIVDRGPNILAASWTTWSVAALVVAARLFARIRGRNFGFDDACIITALGISLFGSIANIFEVHYGFGKPFFALSESQGENLLHWAFAAEVQAVTGVMITKVSICWFVLRLLGPTHRWMRIVIWLCIGLTVTTAAVYDLSQAFVCIPLEAYWNPRVHGKCITKDTISDVLLATNIMNIVSEFICAVFPIYVITRMQMKSTSKWMLCLLTGAGFLAASTSIGQTVSVRQYANADGPDLVIPTYWVIVQQNCSIIIASSPGCWQFIRFVSGNATEANSSMGKSTFTPSPGTIESQDPVERKESLDRLYVVGDD